MIVAEQKKKMKRCPVSMQPDIENLLNDLSPDDFSKASKEEKDDFIQDRPKAYLTGRMHGAD